MTTPTSPTFPDGLPFPLNFDAIDAQQAYELATRVDSYVRQADQTFATVYRPKAFLKRVSVAFGVTDDSSSNFWSNLTTEYDTSGGLPSTTGWIQNRNDDVSWWLFGLEQMLTNTGGVPNTGDHTEAWLQIGQVERFTTRSLNNNNIGFTLVQESNNGGESINLVVAYRIWRATVNPVTGLWGPGTATRQVAINSRFWGLYLGPAGG